MKFFILILFLVSVPAWGGIVELLPKRCDEDLLATKELAEGRIRWTARCHPDAVIALQDFGNTREEKIQNWINQSLYNLGNPANGYLSTVRFPVFTTADRTKTWVAPSDPNASCDTPPEFTIGVLCEEGCYTGHMSLRYANGDMPIAKAQAAQSQNILVLNPFSTLDDLSFEATPVTRYSSDFRAHRQKIITLVMASGGILEVTPNHPLVTAQGKMREAENLKVGDALVRDSGEIDPIVEIGMKEDVIKVYNVFPARDTINGNIVVAQGYLNGSAWYQNEALHLMNRVLLRRTLPGKVLARGDAP